MSTITSPPPTVATMPPLPVPSAAIHAEQRIAIRDIPWDLYDRLSEAIGEGQNVHLAYDGKDLEIMVIGPTHEDAKEGLQLFVKAVAFELRIRCRGLGQTTWKRPETLRGIEADLCYFFDPAKLAIAADARMRRSNDIADYPNPDLAVEIDLSEPKVDRPAIYAMLEIAEIWRFDGQSVVIEQLRGDGAYVPAETSRFLPLRPEDILRWLIDEDSGDEMAWERRLDKWAKSLRRKKAK